MGEESEEEKKVATGKWFPIMFQTAHEMKEW